MGKSRVQDFFTLTLGMLLSVEVRTAVASDNQIKHSCVEIVSKDQRRLSVIMSDYETAVKLRDYIKHFAFLD